MGPGNSELGWVVVSDVGNSEGSAEGEAGVEDVSVSDIMESFLVNLPDQSLGGRLDCWGIRQVALCN